MNDEIKKELIAIYEKKKENKKSEDDQQSLFLDEVEKNTELTMYKVGREVLNKYLSSEDKKFFISVGFCYVEELMKYNPDLYSASFYEFAVGYNLEKSDDKIIFVIESNQNDIVEMKPIFYNKFMRQMKNDGFERVVIPNVKFYRFMNFKINIDKVVANINGLSENSNGKKKVLRNE